MRAGRAIAIVVLGVALGFGPGVLPPLATAVRAAESPGAPPAEPGDSSVETDRGESPGPLPVARDQSVLRVGNVADLDLDQLRSVIVAATPVGPGADQEVRALSLEESLQIALTNNLDIQISEAGVAGGEAAIDEARGRFFPSVGAGGDATGWRRDRDGDRPDETRDRQRALLFLEQEVPTGGVVRLGAGYEREATAENREQIPDQNYDNTNQLAGLSIEIFQPLLRGGRVYVARSQIIDAEYGDDVNRALLSASMLRVKAQTKSAYYHVVRAMRQVEVVERALGRDKQLLEASNALYDAGRVSKVDVHSAEFSLANDEARIATSRAELQVQQNELRRVLGLPVGVKVLVSEPTIPFEPVSIDLTDWITRALRNRPELLQARAELKQAQLAKRVAGNGKLPELGVTGAFQPGFDWASYNYEAGLSFRMPIGNVAPSARYRQAESMRSIAHTNLYRTQREVELEVREFEIRLRQSLERIESLIQAVESARAKREVAAGRFEMGLASNLDVVNADEQMIGAESQLLQAVAEYASTVAKLEAAVGGPL
jgi:outer membrane protein TolC